MDKLKQEVLRVARMAEDSGLCHHGGGNFSMIDRERGLVAITPHAESRYAIEWQDIIVVDTEGNIVENRSDLSPSSETVVHLEVLNSRDDVNAVCHSHPPFACTFATLGWEIKPVICEALMYGGICRVAPFEVPGTLAFAKSVVKAIEGTWAAVLQRHGLVTVGPDIYEAYLKSMYVEDVAQVCWQAACAVGYENVDHVPYDQLDYLMNELHIVG